MTPATASPDALRDLIERRGLTLEAAGVLAGVDAATVSRMINGRTRAQPSTVVALARALGISAKRMQVMCTAAYESAQQSAGAS